jgi:phospholipid/cholesterol/gamma-HCH transport system substrate-binding protein
MAREPTRPPIGQTKPYDERLYRRGPRGLSRTAVGAIAVALILIGTYLAFTKELPFTGAGYEAKAVFENAATLRETAPVRIAGVNVGEVTAVEPNGNATEVTFTVDDEGLPLHTDATLEIRPRLFLEGNFFIDTDPGSPNAPELEDGGTIPVTQN